jgi:hypothetical protein
VLIVARLAAFSKTTAAGNVFFSVWIDEVEQRMTTLFAMPVATTGFSGVYSGVLAAGTRALSLRVTASTAGWSTTNVGTLSAYAMAA